MSDTLSNTGITLGGNASPAAPAPPGPGAGALIPFGLQGRVPPAVARFAWPVGLLAGTGLAAALLWSVIGAEPQRALLPALSDADKPMVAAALDSAGIAYQLDSGSGAIEVAESDIHRARMALAAEGLPRAAPGGSSLLDAMPLGSSRAVEAERLRLSREADLARSIEAVDAVEQARVHLAVEQRSAFVRDRAEPAASVILRLRGGRTLTEAQSAAIVHLVAASVPGLAPERVSIIDQAGRLVSGNGRGGNSPADQQLRIQAETEERLQQALVALLTPIVGADNFSAQVNAQLSFEERQATRETYPENEQRLTREEGARETGEGAGGMPTGIPGALSNRPPPAPAVTAAPPDPAAAQAQGAAGTAVPPSSESFTRQFQWGREVAVTRAASGTVRRLSVAVALANPARGTRSAAEIAAIEALVKGAVGFDAARGDVVTVSARRFAPATPADATLAPGWMDNPWVGTGLRAGLVLLLILAAYFLLMRPFLRTMRARNEAQAQAAALAQERADIPAMADPLRALQGGGTGPALDDILAAPSWTERAGRVRHFAEQHPDTTTQVIHGLLREPQESGRG